MRQAEVHYRYLYVCHSRWIVTAHLARSQVAQCHTGQSAAVRQSSQSGRQGVCLPHARSASCAPLVLLTSQLATPIACSIVATRIDYCNSTAPAATFNALQRVQNILARVVTQSARRSCAKPLLESLHWLPVRQRVTYKLATVCYKARSTSTPAYLQAHVPSRPLRSSHAPRLAIP